MSFEDKLTHARRIGLLADSHGSLSSIISGLDCLKQSRPDTFIHLGDIFDSLHNDNLYEIFKAIARNNFLAVKGNNDYQIETMLNNGQSFDLVPEKKERIKAFLKCLPMRLGNETICFAHSLPFDSIRSFYEPIDTGTTERARQLFDQTSYQIIVCGHSHSSILFRWSTGRVTREPIDPDEPLFFKASERYIVIVGSSHIGECGFFDMDRMTYRRICTSL